MSSSDAQRSPVHHATEDSNLEPSGPNAANPGVGPSGSQHRDSHAGTDAARDRGTERDAARLKNRPDDAMGVPGNFERGAATAGVVPDTDQDANVPGTGPVIGGGPGAGDASSGGGAGAGIPGGGTDMRTDGAFSGGDVEEDRNRLFPEASRHPGQRRTPDDANPADSDESSFGGPLNLDDPDRV
jgi:hypothetical protein